ncbi:putative signal transducing protein [Lysobacter sp. D1-1-M9]|uniref:putative signal transducing protein n=1 Tax=Novilysobacter longmucuonensis TaxID=3098603 RepID=UPI002FCB41CA
MRTVYDAANLIDAHLVRHALEDADIPVFLKGEALVGGMGELPLFGVVQVCVPESAVPKAREVVDALGFGTPAARDEESPDAGVFPSGAPRS